MEKKCFPRTLVLLINFCAAIAGILIIREFDRDRLKKEEAQQTIEAIGVDEALLAKQKIIADVREQKLRDLNTSPREEKRIDTNTITTTTKKSTTPSRSNSSGSSSSSSTKTS